jgi:hypothetical protein
MSMKTFIRTFLESLLLCVLAPCALAAPAVEAFLYNPSADVLTVNYPYNRPADRDALKPSLNLAGSGFPDGEIQLSYSVDEKGRSLFSGVMTIKVERGHFNQQVDLPQKFPQADAITWRLKQNGTANAISGQSALTWSRFHGKVVYKSGVQRSTYIALIPLRWGAPGNIDIPVAEDGSFDAQVPARIYSVVNVNGGGYLFDAMERWAGTYDLTQDREDRFDVGRTEVYGLRAFDIVGGPNTIFLYFRPSSLTRVMHFDANGDGILSADERKAMSEALKSSPTAIGPELTAGNVKVWFDGAPVPVVQLNQIPEFDGGGSWQVNYLVQCPLPAGRIADNVWHHVRVEVESQETLRGKTITDFGQSSVDILWPR